MKAQNWALALAFTTIAALAGWGLNVFGHWEPALQKNKAIFDEVNAHNVEQFKRILTLSVDMENAEGVDWPAFRDSIEKYARSYYKLRSVEQYNQYKADSMRIVDSLRALAQEQVPNIVETTASDSPTAINETIEQNGTSGAVVTNSADLELNWGGFPSWVGIVFDGFSIPAGATITAATISFESDNNESAGPPSVTIHGEKGASPPAFTSGNQSIKDRVNTTNTVAWNSIPAWSTGERSADTTTPDISDIIQEIIDDPAYTQGDNIVIGFEPGGGTSRRRGKDGFNYSASERPILEITYESAE